MRAAGTQEAVSDPRAGLRALAWYFGIGSAPEAERRRLERDAEDEDRPWWRTAVDVVAGAALVETIHYAVGFDHPLADYVVAGAILFVVGAVAGLIQRQRRSERPPVD